MLTSSANQYLRPEYLTPLPTTLDAKKSPLALLAQTCSQIGADPSGKSLLASLDGKTSNGKSSKTSCEQSREKLSPTAAPQPPPVTENIKSSFKPYESCLGGEKASSPEEARAPSSHSTSGRSRTPGSSGKRCSSNQSACSARAVTPLGRRTATPNNEATRESPGSRGGGGGSTAPPPPPPPPTTVAEDAVGSSQGEPCSPILSKYNSSSSPTGAPVMTDSSIKDLPLGTFKAGSSMPVSTSSAYLGYPTQLPIDVLATALTSQHHAALKNGLTSTTNPYLSYARIKTNAAGDSLVPICRDPFCTGCQLNPHFLTSSAANGKVPTSSASSCPAGCVQCDHKPNPSSYGSMNAHTTAAAAYAHAQLAAIAAASQLPYVCNWITGDGAYCGKRFPSSEELLQHLRSHTSVSAGDPPTAAALSLLSPPGLTHPLLSRTYPTPPLSPLATARYHPYGKPSPLIQPSLSTLGFTFPPHHPSTPLQPYFSPYSLYGMARLGAASGMHP